MRLMTLLGATEAGQEAVRKVAHDDLLQSPAATEAYATYRRVGGIQDAVPHFPPLRWDMTLDGVAVELDEAQHFNRYRAITLDSPVYEALQGLPTHDYRTWCAEHEGDALARQRQGPGFWKNPSTERQFGASGPRGDLSGPGSSRYKQRAFYDFLRDLSPWIAGTAVARVSTWDGLELTHGPVLVGDVLLSQYGDEAQDALRGLVRKRLVLALSTLDLEFPS